MGDSSRNRILGRLRQQSEAPAQSPQQRTGPLAAPVIEQFIHCLEGAHAEVIHTSRQDWMEDLGRLALERDWHHWGVGKDGPGEAWRAHAPRGLDVRVWGEEQTPEERDAMFDSVQVGLTGCETAVAETGTLVLASGPGQPRELSLVPPVHVILVERGQIQADFAAALAHVRRQYDPLPTNLIWVSGPSKTADIQQTLAYGAHGPKELIVLFCDNL